MVYKTQGEPARVEKNASSSTDSAYAAVLTLYEAVPKVEFLQALHLMNLRNRPGRTELVSEGNAMGFRTWYNNCTAAINPDRVGCH